MFFLLLQIKEVLHHLKKFWMFSDEKLRHNNVLLLGTFDLLGKPHPKKTCIFGHCPNCNLTPPIAQIRALCGTNTLPKMRKFLKQHFWLWEWIFWQWLRSKMILRWYSDGNGGNYWWNWWQSSGSVMVYIHWRTATKIWAMPKFTQFFFGWGFPYNYIA